MYFRPDPLEPAKHLQVVVERQLRVKAVDHLNFSQRRIGSLAQLVPRLLKRHRVRPRITGPKAGERAEQATGHADVGGPESDVEVVVGPAAVLSLALAIGEPADRQE